MRDNASTEDGVKRFMRTICFVCWSPSFVWAPTVFVSAPNSLSSAEPETNSAWFQPPA